MKIVMIYCYDFIRLKVFLICSILLCITYVKAQTLVPVTQDIPYIDSVFVNKNFTKFLEDKSHQWSLPFNKGQLDNLKKVIGFEDFTKTNTLKFNKNSIGVESFWNYGDTLLYGLSANQSLTYVTPDLSISVFNMPIKFSANFVFRDNDWQKNLTTYKVKIDYETLLEQKKKALYDAALQDKIKTWSKDDITCWANKTKWDAIYNVVNHPEFKKSKKNLETKIDSLENLADNNIGKVDKELDNLKSEYEQYKDVDKSFKVLLDYYRQNNKAFQKAEALKSDVTKAQSTLEKQKNDIQNKLDYKKITKLEKVKESVKGLDIGSFDIIGSHLTTQNILLNGGRIETYVNKYYNELAYGKQSTASNNYQRGFNTVYGANDLDRRLFYYRGGIGKRDSSFLHFTFLRVIDDYKNTKTLIKPKANDVLSISGHQSISKNIAFETEFAYSLYKSDVIQNFVSSSEGVRNTDSLSSNGFRNTAFRFSIIPAGEGKNGWKWALGYNYIGDKYVSLGNPYLLNNRQILRGEVKKRFSKPRLNFRISYDRQIGAAKAQALSPSISQTGLTAEGSWQYRGSNKLTLQFMPRYFLMTAQGGEGAIGRYDMYAVQNMLQGKIKGWRWLSYSSITNMNMTMKTSDTAQFSGLNYLFSQLMLMPTEKWVISSTGNIGLDGRLNALKFREAMYQLDSRNDFKKGSLTLGVQSFYIKNTHTRVDDMQIGLTIGGSSRLKWITLGAQSNIRKSIIHNNERFIFSGQTFCRINF